MQCFGNNDKFIPNLLFSSEQTTRKQAYLSASTWSLYRHDIILKWYQLNNKHSICMHLHNAHHHAAYRWKCIEFFELQRNNMHVCLSVCLPAYVICFGTKILNENNQIHFLLNASQTKCKINDCFEFDVIWNGWAKKNAEYLNVSFAFSDMHICSFNCLCAMCMVCFNLLSILSPLPSFYSQA